MTQYRENDYLTPAQNLARRKLFEQKQLNNLWKIAQALITLREGLDALPYSNVDDIEYELIGAYDCIQKTVELAIEHTNKTFETITELNKK